MTTWLHYNLSIAIISWKMVILKTCSPSKSNSGDDGYDLSSPANCNENIVKIYDFIFNNAPNVKITSERSLQWNVYQMKFQASRWYWSRLGNNSKTCKKCFHLYQYVFESRLTHAVFFADISKSAAFLAHLNIHSFYIGCETLSPRSP